MNRVRCTLFLVLTVLIVAGILSANTVHANASTIEIIANPTVNTSKLNASQLRRIFTMRQSTWPDGQPVKVFVMDTRNPLHQQFCKSVLKMFPYQIERTWNKLAYSGLGDKPLTLSNEMQMIEAIRNSPGAIGYIVGTDMDRPLIQRIEVTTE